MKHIVIVSYAFSSYNLRLQPWRTLYEYAIRLHKNGFKVTIVTDGRRDETLCEQLAGVQLYAEVCLSPFRMVFLSRLIRELKPAVLLWPIGVRSIAYTKLLRKYKKIVLGYIPGLIQTGSDWCAAIRFGLMPETGEALLWTVAKRLAWGRMMAASMHAIMVMSDHNYAQCKRIGFSDDTIIRMPVTFDEKITIPQEGIESQDEGGEQVTALFMGWPTRVRGINLLLDAFRYVAQTVPRLHIRILARGENTRRHDALRTKVARHPYRERISCREGMLEPDEIMREIQQADFGVLPFLTVPADTPRSFIEFFSYGKPVLTTDASGLGELVADMRGVCVQRSVRSVAGALSALSARITEQRAIYREHCSAYLNSIVSWDEGIGHLITEINNRF